ncbi:MAG: hypothetical protein JWM02_3678 [Frankiales bacterium]|nr:hypothetical protein [Frankiales bacterium]
MSAPEGHSRAIQVRIRHAHDDLGNDDYHEWVQIGSNTKADRLGRPNNRMYCADWQPWVCNNPDCKGYVLVHLDAVQDLIVQAIEAGEQRV